MPLLDRFRAFSNRQQIAFVCIVAAASFLLFAAAWFFLLRTSYQPLFSNLRPADAATIVAALDHKKIAYQLADGGSTVLVPSDIADATRLSVGAEDLPLKGTVGFELFNKSDMGLTDFAQKINYQRALQGELERTIMTLDGVDTARVHLSLGEDRVFRDDRVPPKASVTIRMRGGRELSPNAAVGIQRLVAAAVPNLAAGDVVILDEKGGVIGAVAPERSSLTEAPFAQIQQGVEEYYEGLLRQALSQAYPQANIVVSVLANLSAKAGKSVALDWNPAARDFPLQIGFASAVPLDSAMQQSLRALAANAAGFDAAKNDALVFAIASDERPPETTAPATHQSLPLKSLKQAAGTEETGEVPWQTFGTAALVFGLILTLILFAGRQLRAPRRLSQKQRQEFVERLRAALVREGSHATSPP